MNLPSLVGHIIELYELIDKSTQPADNVTAEFFRSKRYLGSHDRRYIAENVFGMLRHRRFIETMVKHYVEENRSTTDLEDSHVRFLSYYVAFQVVVEQSQVSRIVEALHTYWRTFFPKIDLASFTQWISLHQNLDFLQEDEIIRLGIKYSFQDWMVREWKEQFVDETENLLNALNTSASITLRVNILKTNRDECRQRLREEGIETEPTRLSPVGLAATKRFNRQASATFKDGWFEMQDEGSQLISVVAAPQPCDVVIDACAGAGGKTLHLAELMRDDGEIIAIDVDRRRLYELESRAERAGVHCIRTQRRDELVSDNLFGKADLVLVDAPCSGVGTIRRNPGFKWSVTESLVQHYAEQQAKLLLFNSQFVKKSGRLVYATCSLFRRENEDVVNSFLTLHTDFVVISAEKYRENFGISDDSMFTKFLPHKHRTDGFFVAVLSRIS